MPRRTRVLVVGGGPVGLFLAALLATTVGRLRIVLFEKRAVYVREQVLLVRNDTLQVMKDRMPGMFDRVAQVGCFGTYQQQSRGRVLH